MLRGRLRRTGGGFTMIELIVAVGLMVILLGREVRKSHDVGYVSPYADEAISGAYAEVRYRLAPTGEVILGGERWEAELTGGGVAEVGERVRVAERRENRLLVEFAPEPVATVEEPDTV